MSKRSVAVIFGGASSEYEVSLRSASFVISGVDREKYDLTMVGITKKGQWLLYSGPEDAIADDGWNPAGICNAGHPSSRPFLPRAADPFTGRRSHHPAGCCFPSAPR